MPGLSREHALQNKRINKRINTASDVRLMSKSETTIHICQAYKRAKLQRSDSSTAPYLSLRSVSSRFVANLDLITWILIYLENNWEIIS